MGDWLRRSASSQRTNYDIEMMRQMGYCKGIENYARHLSGATAWRTPGRFVGFFPDDFLTIIDESHVTVPQVGACTMGIELETNVGGFFGFRLPSALDNRPLQFEEFEDRLNCVIYTSATPGNYELKKVEKPTPTGPELVDRYDVAEQVIRPTGLLDPVIFMQKTEGQMAHLLDQISSRIEKEGARACNNGNQTIK